MPHHDLPPSEDQPDEPPESGGYQGGLGDEQFPGDFSLPGDSQAALSQQANEDPTLPDPPGQGERLLGLGHQAIRGDGTDHEAGLPAVPDNDRDDFDCIADDLADIKKVGAEIIGRLETEDGPQNGQAAKIVQQTIDNWPRFFLHGVPTVPADSQPNTNVSELRSSLHAMNKTCAAQVAEIATHLLTSPDALQGSHIHIRIDDKQESSSEEELLVRHWQDVDDPAGIEVDLRQIAGYETPQYLSAGSTILVTPKPEEYDLDAASHLRVTTVLELDDSEDGNDHQRGIFQLDYVITEDTAHLQGVSTVLYEVSGGEADYTDRCRFRGETDSLEGAVLIGANLVTVLEHLRLASAADGHTGDTAFMQKGNGQGSDGNNHTDYQHNLPAEIEPSADQAAVTATDAGDSGNDPPDRPEKAEQERDWQELITLRNKAFTAAVRELRSSLADDNVDPNLVDQAQQTLAQVVAQMGRSLAKYPDVPNIGVTSDQLTAVVPLILQNEVAAGVFFQAAFLIGNDQLGEQLSQLLNIEKAALMNRLEDDSTYQPHAADHLVLDSIVQDYERWIIALEPSIQRSVEQPRVREIIETYGASKEAKWQSYTLHLTQRLVESGNDEYYRDLLHHSLERLFVSNGEFDDRFIMTSTYEAILSTGDVSLRQKLADNYLYVADGQEQSYPTDDLDMMSIAVELLPDHTIPQQDAPILINAIHGNQSISDAMNAGDHELHPHTRTLIRLNSRIADRILDVDPNANPELHARDFQQMKLLITAYAGQPIDQIVAAIHAYNASWQAASAGSTPTAQILLNHTLIEIADRFGVSNQPGRALDAIAQMDRRTQTHALVTVWSHLTSTASLAAMQPEQMDSTTADHYETARIIQDGEPTQMYARGELLAQRIFKRMAPLPLSQQFDDPTLILDWHQLNTILDQLSTDHQLLAQTLAVRALEICSASQARYSNAQLGHIYDALVVKPEPASLDPDHLFTVRDTIIHATDRPELKAEIWAQFALHVVR